MSDEEANVQQLTDGESTELLDMFNMLGVTPKGKTPEEVQNWMLDYLNLQGKLPQPDSPPPAMDVKPVTNTVTVTTRIPSLPIFSGTDKNESFETWRFELNCLLAEQQYSKEAITEAARKSLKGEAAKVARRTGTNTGINVIISKLSVVFGDVTEAEDMMAIFYNVKQKPKEDVALWSCRLEDILEQASHQKYIHPTDRLDKLKTRLYMGLKEPLKGQSHHLYKRYQDYDEFRMELRKLENTLKSPDVEIPRSENSPTVSNISQSHVTNGTIVSEKNTLDS